MSGIILEKENETRKYDVWTFDSLPGEYTLHLYKNKNHRVCTTKSYRSLDRAVKTGDAFLAH
jgi:hypothetical protein